MNLQEACEVLGIEKGASERNVRRAYRALLFDLEDNGQSDPAYLEKKDRLNAAFEVCLSDAANRTDVSTTPSAEDSAPSATAVRNKLLLRVGVGVILILLLIRGFMWYQAWSSDLDGESPAVTVGMIAALEASQGGTQVVAFRQDGSKIDTPAHTPGTVDQDIAWRPDGGRVLFTSNREGGNFNVFRWNPIDGKLAVRSIGDRAKSNLWFGWTNEKALRDTALFTAGGFVFRYDQKKTTTEQLLPPATRKAQGGGDEGQGNVGQMDAIYKQIGETFLGAKWGIDRQVIWSVMRRENDQVLVFNPLLENYNKGIPKPIFAAKQIDFDVLPDGNAIASLHKFQFLDPANVDPKYLVDGKPMAPFDDAIYFLPADGGTPAVVCHTVGPQLFFGGVGQQPKPMDKISEGTFVLGAPAVSPDGSAFVFVLGRATKEGSSEGLSIVVFPLKEGGTLKAPGKIALGDVSQPSWAPEGDRITYVKRQGGVRAIFVANVTGGVETKISGDGDFFSPKFSPQLKQAEMPAQ